MARIQTYESQIPASVGVDYRRMDGASDGGLSGLAQGVATFVEQRQRRELEQDESDSLSAVAQLKAELAERRHAATLDGKAADPDWIETEREYAQRRLSEVTGNLRTQDGKRRANLRNTQLLAEETGRMLHTQSTVSAGLQKNKLQNVEDLTLRAIQQDPDSHRGAVDTFLSDLQGPAYAQLSKDVKEDYARQFKFKAARTYLEGVEQAFGAEEALASLAHVRADMPAEQYTSIKDHYTNRAKAEKSKTDEMAQYNLFRSIDDTIKKGGDPRSAIEKGVESKLMSAEQGIGLHDKYEKYVELQRKITAADSAFRMNDLAGFSEVEANIRKDVADRWIAEQMQTYQQASPDEKKAISNQIVKKGVEMDYVFSGVKNSLRATPHGDGFSKAVDLYRSLEKFDPYYASKYVSDDQRARFDVYTMASQGGATVEQSLEMARAITPESIAKTKQVLGTEEGRSVRESLKSKLSDKPYWGTGSMLNGQQATNAVLQRATVMLAGNPAAELETVVESARIAYEHQNVRMGNLWVPRAFLSGVPADRMADVAGRITARLPGVLKAQKLPVVDGEYMLAPDNASDKDSRLQVYDPSGFPIPGLRFGSADFKAEYRSMQGEEYERKRTPFILDAHPGLGS